MAWFAGLKLLFSAIFSARFLFGRSPKSSSVWLDELNTAWVLNPYDRTVLNVDPVSHTVLTRITIDSQPTALAVGEGAVWIIEAIDAERSNILRLDPFSQQITARIPITNGEAVSVQAGGGSVWVSVAGEYGINEAPGGGVEFDRRGSLARISPNTNQVAEVIELDGIASDLLVEDQVLWVLVKKKSYSFINKIDLDTRVIYTIPDSILSSDYVHRFETFARIGDWFWMTPQDSAAHYVFRISAGDGVIDSSISLGDENQDSPVQILVQNDSLWAALRSGRIVQVDTTSMKIVKTIQTEAVHLSELFSAGGFLWAVSYGDALLIQIDPQSGEIVDNYSTGNAPPPTPTPTTTPTPNPNLIWALCDQSFPTNLRVGMKAVVNNDPPIPNRVRIEPNTESLILGYIQPGEIVEVLTGPVCQNGWVWWNILSRETGLNGWTSEGDGTDYWLLPVEEN